MYNKYLYLFVIVWHSQYGKEDIDEFDTEKEARKMAKEYRLAYREGSISVVKRRVKNENYKEI